MSITHDQYRRARYIVEPAAKLLQDATHPNNRGRKPKDYLIFLVGMQLCMDTYGMATISKIHSVLTRDLMLKDQVDLGLYSNTTAEENCLLTTNDLYSMSKRITKTLSYSRQRVGHLSDEERHHRRDLVDQVVNALIERTLIPRPDNSHDYALDGTGIWASERSKKIISRDIPIITGDQEDEESESGNPQNDQGCATASSPALSNDERQSLKPGKGSKGVSDAGHGGKTSKDGRAENFFGYDVEALVRVPAINSSDQKVRTEPTLLEALVVLPASTDIVNPCLKLLDRMLGQGIKIQSLLVDRHYSFKVFDRWAQGLRARSIEQVSDLRSDEHGFKDWDGMRVAAGWAHCPQTPDRLAKIAAPGLNATEDEMAGFNKLINERRQYAAQRNSLLTVDGKIRYTCPARNGTLGCPLVLGSVATAMAANLPLIADPPAEIGRPSICGQQTVQVQIESKEQKVFMKPYQRHYWGSKEWYKSYSRRTYVEGWFGIFKNDTSTGYDRGSHQFRGLPLVSIVIGIAAATTNLRLLQSWHRETTLGDDTHPLLKADLQFNGYKQLSAEEAAMIHEENRKNAA